MPLLEDKSKSSMLASREVLGSMAPGEGTFTNPGNILGPRASILGSHSVVEKFLEGLIPLVDKEKVDKLSQDQVFTKFFHIVYKVSIRF